MDENRDERPPEEEGEKPKKARFEWGDCLDCDVPCCDLFDLADVGGCDAGDCDVGCDL